MDFQDRELDRVLHTLLVSRQVDKHATPKSRATAVPLSPLRGRVATMRTCRVRRTVAVRP
jgi:hypothetical protein